MVLRLAMAVMSFLALGWLAYQFPLLLLLILGMWAIAATVWTYGR